MNSVSRFLKKVIIIFLALVILFGIVYLLTRPKKDPCFDGIQNNREEGVDCGGFCDAVCAKPDRPDYVQDIKINWVKFTEDGRNNYDLVASLSNENEKWGVSSVKYKFAFYDEAENLIGEKEGTTFIMPKGDTEDPSVKYLIEDNVTSNTPIAKASITLSDYDWQELASSKDVYNLNENIIKISEKTFGRNKVTNFYEASGVTYNTSIYDFFKVDINVVVFGKEGQILAAGKTNQLTLATGDGWRFVVSFPNFAFEESEIESVDYKSETNVFDSNNLVNY